MPAPRDPLRSLPLRYRAILRLLPAHVREEHARELRDDITEEAPPITSFAADVARGAVAAHLDILRRDLAVALRQLRRAPTFAVVAGATLALGIGGNVAFFTLVDGVLVRPLPLAGADRLVDVTEENAERGYRAFGISPANFRDLTADTSLFAAAAVYDGRDGTVRIGESLERVRYASVGADFFRVLTERPVLGRTLVPEDDVPDAGSVVIGSAYWRHAFGGDPAVVGRAMEVDGQRVRVVGVMPDGFAFPSPNTVFWRPIGLGSAEVERRGARSVSGIARLRAGISVESAARSLERTAAALAEAHPRTNGGWTVLVRELRAARVANVRTGLLIAWGAGTLVLLITMANVASLLLTRALARERELALRTALGARTGRIVRQLVTETLLLAVVGTAAGLVVAWLALEWMRPLADDFVPRMQEVALDGRAVVYATVLAIAATTLLSLAATPSVRRGRLWSALGTARSGRSHRSRRLQRSIVVGEVALAAFVLVAGALVVRTLSAVLAQPMGFDSRALLTFRIEPPWRVEPSDSMPIFIRNLEADRHRAAEGYDALLARLRGLAGVEEAGTVNRLPLTGDWWSSGFRLPERPNDEDRIPAYVRSVTPGYLEAMGTRLLRGRAIERSDGEGAPRVLVIDAELARRAWADADPIGREVLLDGPPSEPALRVRVVGVVETIHMNRLDGDLRPTMYVPFAQSGEGHYLNWGMDVVVRGNAGLPEADVRRAAREAFPDAVVFRIATIDEIVARSTADRRFHLLVLGAFGVLALVLSTVGVGGTLLLAVRDRREELAVRLALGAGPSRLWWAVQRDGLLLSAAGAAIGLVGAVAGARIFSSMVYGVPVRDPASLLGAFGLVVAAAFLATAVPARRAMRVDPASTMRE